MIVFVFYLSVNHELTGLRDARIQLQTTNKEKYSTYQCQTIKIYNVMIPIIIKRDEKPIDIFLCAAITYYLISLVH